MLENQNVGGNSGALGAVDASSLGVGDVLGQVKSLLQKAASASGSDIFSQVLGDKANTLEIQAVRSAWSLGDFSQLPSIQILSAANMNGAFGGYASSTKTVYLSDALFKPDAAPVDSLLGAAGVLTEETFHWLDDRVGVDTQGDEGELARMLIFGTPMSSAELTRIKQENDSGFITVEQQLTPVEMATPTLVSIESLGNTKLVKDTSNFLYAQVGSNTPISIKYNGQAITSTSFPGWQTLAVETISGQNRVLWKDTINNTISVWQTDSNWNYLSTTAASTLNSPDALTQEINFGLDLNGDNVLGNTFSSIESLGNTKLVRDTGNFLYAQVGSNTPISIKYNGQAITSTSFPGWQTLAVETIGGQNRILWKDTINNTISVWQTDSNWNYLSTSAASALNSPDALTQEINFGLDLNGDSKLGTTYTSVESLGNTKLVKDTSNFLYAQVGSNTPISIKYNGQAITSTSFPGWQTLAVETISGQNRVLWKDTINNTVSVWQTDSNWNYLSTSVASTLNSPDALTQEINFGLDLNGDSKLGTTYTSVESLGNTKLVKDTSNFLYAQVGSNTPISIKYNGQAITSTSFPGWQTLAVETISGQNRVLWKDTINNTISVWQTDSNWNYLSTSNAIALSSPDSLIQETNFGLDLNSDGIVGSSPDLVITGQTAPSTVTVGGSVTIGAYTKNNGNGNAGSSYVGYWLSNNTTLDSSDIYINSGYISPLNAGASQYNSWTFTYNSSWGTGTKYVLFEADSSGGFVTESNESNNVAYATIFVSPSPSPDLVITGQTAPSTVTVGGNVSIGAYTQNNGSTIAGASTTRYWLSNDTTWDSSDIALGSQSINSLTAGTSQYNSLNFAYNNSWGTGTKYILFQADGYGYVSESNESNNVAYATIFVSDWYSQNLKDAGLIGLTRSLAADGNLSRNDMIAIFTNAEDGSTIDANELIDLRTIVNNASLFTMADYVKVLSNKIANSDLANSRSGFGNLSAGSSSTQMQNLINKWFLGLDRPDLTDASYVYNYTSGSLFQNGISYTDVNQGAVGDCYFLAGLANTAFRSVSTIQNMFIDNGDNTYTVRFYNNNVADYVTVDRYLPTTSYGGFVYAHQSGSSWGSYNNSSNELWVMLAEKAYAQMNESGWLDGAASGIYTNSYSSIESGYGGGAIRDIAGGSTTYKTLTTSDFSSIVNAFNSGQMVYFGSKSTIVNTNVVEGHGYALVGYNSSTQKFTLYNPWGTNGGYLNGYFKPGYLDLSISELVSNFNGWELKTA